jgi:rubrerythrin
MTIPRRELLRLAGLTSLAGPALLLAACGDDDDDESRETDTGGGEADVGVLNAVLDVEHLAIAAYAAGDRLLAGDARAAAGVVGGQEQEHADRLLQVIRDLGGTPHGRRPAREYAPMFAGLRSREDVLRYAVDLERTAVAAYVDALPKLSSEELRGTVAGILTNEAEHVSVLLGLLGEDQAPDAFPGGP